MTKREEFEAANEQMHRGIPHSVVVANAARLAPFYFMRGDHEECWEWLGRTTWAGYGLLSASIGGKAVAVHAHRLIYELDNGTIPDGLVIDHLCRNRACVNPSHMRVTTNRVNILAGFSPSAQNAKKTHCSNGHEYGDGNTYFRKCKGATHRACRACHREWQRVRRRNAALRKP